MKKTAFIQAVILFCLLAVTWVFLIVKLQERDKEVEEAGDSRRDLSQADVVEKVPALTAPEDPLADEPAPPDIPGAWQPWMGRFASADSAREMRILIDELKTGIFTLEKADAVAFINAFLASGADLRTGLAFQTAREGDLVGAAYLRAILLDWLFQLDPLRAAAMAREALQEEGTGLTPDEYVIHMRNYRLGTRDDDVKADVFLKDKFKAMIRHKPWMQEPTSAVAKAFEAAVVTGATELVPEFIELMEKSQPPLLRNAGAVTVERLVDRAPLATAEALLGNAGQADGLNLARAGYIARLDPGMPGAAALFEAYLDAPGVGPEEINYFLRSFPNLNRTVSYPLFRNYNSSTERVDYSSRFRNALRQIRQWKGDPRMAAFSETLEAVEANLSRHLGEIPSP